MIIRYQGHSFFTITTKDETVIATDPYHVFYNYPQRSIRADICTVSHHHSDHDGVQSIAGAPLVIDTIGNHSTHSGVRIIGIPTKHDDENGTLRGDNIFFVIEADGMRIGHAGDLGHMLTSEQLKSIGALDVLLLPVGGYYTIDAKVANDVRNHLKPHITIPMHYKTEYNQDMPIASLAECMSDMNEDPQHMPLLRIVREDLKERPHMIVLIPTLP